MKECKDALAVVAVDPRSERVHGLRAIALGVGQRLAAAGHLDAIVEEVEAAADACLMPQDECRNSRAGGVAGGLEARGERPLVRTERIADVVADAVVRRQETREKRRMRRQRQRTVAVDILEDDAFAAQSIEGRRRSAAVAV